MAKQVKRRRGTSAEHDSFTGVEGELTIDVTAKTAVVHDGITAGGFPLGRADATNIDLANKINVAQLASADGSPGDVLSTDGFGQIAFGPITISGNSIGIAQLNVTDGNNDDVLHTDGSGNLSFKPITIVGNSVGITELDVSDGTAGQALITNGAGVLSFGDVVTDPALGGDLTGTTANAQIGSNTVGITELNVTDGTADQVLSTDGSGNLSFQTVASGGTSQFVEDIFTGDGSTTTFTLSQGASSEETILVYIDGVGQPTSAYSLPTTTSIEFNPAPPNTSSVRVLHMGVATTLFDFGGSSSVFIEETFTGNGSTATYTMTTEAPSEESILVFLDGLAQPTTSYTLPSNTSITFSSAPSTGTSIRIVHLGIANNIGANSVGVNELDLTDGTLGQVLTTNGSGTISFSSITSAMIGNGVIVAQDIATNAVNGTHIQIGGDNAGDILYYNGTDYVSLGIGSAGQTLTVNSGGNAPEWAAGGGGGFVTGMIMMWSGSVATVPTGWVICDGTNSTPDLRDRFIVGAGSTYNPDDTGGSTSTGAHQLTIGEMPTHSHTFSYSAPAQNTPAFSATLANNIGSPGTVNSGTDNAGGDGSHSHANSLPPYYALAFIMKT